MRRGLPAVAVVVAALALSCAAPVRAPSGSIRDVVVVLRGSDEPLPFDPRAARLMAVAREVEQMVGHPVVLELEAALSPELRASLEETVIGSFESLARELAVMKRDEPAMFAEARRLERVVCKYDVLAKRTKGRIEGGGAVLAVDAPPDRFPLLERGVATEALWLAHVDGLDAKFGEADPAKLPASERAAYFAYMTLSRPGYGYLWLDPDRRKLRGAYDARATLRVERVGRVLRLASVLEPGSELERRVRAHLVDLAAFVGGLGATSSPNAKGADPAVVRRVFDAYQGWLVASAKRLDDRERLVVMRALFEPRPAACGRDCGPDAIFPRFDRFAFALAIYDGWARAGAPTPAPETNERGKLWKAVVCPKPRLGPAGIRYGCSAFFEVALRDDALRARLASVISKRRDTRLLDAALLNPGYGDGVHAVALVEALSSDDALFRRGARLLFDEYARRADVKHALEEAAVRWWRDRPARRGLALLVMARQQQHLDVHYADSHWTRFASEFGGPVSTRVLASFLAEGPRAVEMTPKIWLALAKSPERDDLVAKSLTGLLDDDLASRTSRARPALDLLHDRLCAEHDAHGLDVTRMALERWIRLHPDDALVASIAHDMTPASCPK